MTPQIRNHIAIFKPQGFIDGNNAPSIITDEDLKLLNRHKLRGVMLCFEKVIFFNKNGIFYLADVLLKIRKEKDIEVGILPYKNSVYKQLMHFFKGHPEIHLFQSLKVLDTLMDGKKDGDEEKILIFSADGEQRGSLLMRLREKGFEKIDIAKSQDELESKIKQIKYTMIINSTFLTNFSKVIPYYTKDNAVIYTLEGYIDGAINDNFDFEYHKNSLLTGFKNFIFDCKKVNSLNTHAMNFFNRLSIDGAEQGINICISGFDLNKIPKGLLNELEVGGIFFSKSVTDALNDKDFSFKESGAATKKEPKAISKKLVKEVSIFIDGTVETVEVMTGAKSNKVSVTIGECNILEEKEFISASIGFFEDLEGILFLFFPRELAKKACVLLLGEDSKTISEELDALSELLSIIIGRVKTALYKEKGLSIKNTLPRTFDKIEKVKMVIGDRKGVFVQMTFDNEPFYFFLTR